MKGGCGIKQAAQNFVGHLFRKPHRQFAADLVYNCGCAGNEIEHELFGVRAIADRLCSAIEVSPLYAMRKVVPVASE